jgi:hypothetical protein
MSDDTTASKNDPSAGHPSLLTHAATEVRFSIRSLLILTAIAAPLAAGVGIIVRRTDSRWQTSILVTLAASIVFLLACAVYIAWRRHRAEQSAGRVFFDLVLHSYILPHRPRLASTLAGVALLLLFLPVLIALCFAATFGLPHGSATDIMLDVIILFGYVNVLSPPIAGLAYIWWGRRVRFCVNGVVVRHTFIPWQWLARYSRFYWDAAYRGVCVLKRKELIAPANSQEHNFFQLLKEGGRYGNAPRWIAVIVPPDERAAFEALLKEKLQLPD